LETVNYWSHFKSDLNDRFKTYEKQLDTCITSSTTQHHNQKDLIVDLMHDYASLTSSGEKNKRECLRNLEQKLSESPQPQIMPSIDLDEETTKQISVDLAKSRENRLLEHQKQQNEAAFTQPWTDVEMLSLLRGVAKYGEHSWSEICDRASFQAFRTPNALANKWAKIKTQILQDIQKIYSVKGIIVSKWDWIQCAIHKLEIKCGYLAPHPPMPTIAPNQLMRLPQAQKPAWMPHGPINPLNPISQGRSIGVQMKRPSERAGSVFRQENNLSGDPLKNKLNQLNSEINVDKKPSALQQLSENYIECINKFKSNIESGKFNLEDVRKYITSKEATPIYPKYFKLHYEPRNQNRAEETPKKPVFKLHPKEPSQEPQNKPKDMQVTKNNLNPTISLNKPGDQPSEIQVQPLISVISQVDTNMPEMRKTVSEPVTNEEKSKVEPRKEQPINLKKLFLHNKMAQLSGTANKEDDNQPQNQSDPQAPLNN